MTRKKKIILISIIIILVLGLFSMFSSHHHEEIKAQKGLNSQYVLLNQSDISNVKYGSVDNVIAFTGDLTPLNQTIISSEVDAQVLSVLVSEGQFVNKNQVLATLDSTDLEQAVSQEKAALATAIAKFQLDKNKLEREKDLYQQGFISKFSYDELQTNYQSSLEAVNQQKASLERAQKQLSYTVIKAPFAGYVYQKNIDSGQVAAKNGKLFSLANLDIMQIKAAIPSAQINNVHTNQLVNFKVETNDKTYVGKITRMNPVAEEGTRSYFIYINFDNTTYKLTAGQFVKGQIILNKLNNVTFVPSNVIRKSDNSPYVLALVNNKIISIPVKVLLTNSITDITAISGIESGTQVLSGTVFTVKPGDNAKVAN